MFVVSRDKLVIQKFKKGKKPTMGVCPNLIFLLFSVVPVYCNDLSDFWIPLSFPHIAKDT